MVPNSGICSDTDGRSSSYSVAEAIDRFISRERLPHPGHARGGIDFYVERKAIQPG